MVGMREAVEAIRATNGAGVRIIVGGAPVTAEFAREMGADGYAPDAGSAVEAAKRLLGGVHEPTDAIAEARNGAHHDRE